MQWVAFRGLCLERHTELGLTPGAPKEDDQYACNFQRQCGSMVFFQKREREIDASGYFSRGIIVPVLNPNGCRINVYLWKAFRQFGGERPMSRGAAAVEKPGFSQQK